MIYNVYLPSATKLRQGNVFRSVCQKNSVHRRVSASVHAGIHNPQADTHPFWADSPPGRQPQADTTPLGRYPWADTPTGQIPHPLGRHQLLGRHPRGRHPHWTDTPLGRHLPWQTPLGQTPPWSDPPQADTPCVRQTPLGRHPRPPSRRLLQRTVRILLECILVIMLSKAKLVYFCLKKILSWKTLCRIKCVT